ncbi:MAG TPA: phage terminase large subunit, partial [Methanocorpusculum sp.]|nr:phage terminase large subunit [Methanocorpusculum sp.]
FFEITCRDDTSRSEIWIGGLDDKDRVDKILGAEYSTIYLNEASQISYLAYQTALSRLAQNTGLNNKVFIDCNPSDKSSWVYSLFELHQQPSSQEPLKNPDLYGRILMNPQDNPHLPADYISDVLMTLSERQQQRFLKGEWQDTRSDALFKREHIERARVSSMPQYMPYAVVGIDPAVTNREDSDETGIISVGRDQAGDYYVLRDDSLKGSPAEWADRVNAAYCALELDAAVYETNQGGDMVEHTIHVANPRIPCHGVRATRGKAVRAEPVVALYEQGRVHHVGYFPELEETMTDWVPGDTKSPDRLDALVWAITYLMERPVRSGVVVTVPTAGHGGYQKYNLGRSSGGGFPRPPVFGRGFDR